jgi:hypothetical protein
MSVYPNRVLGCIYLRPSNLKAWYIILQYLRTRVEFDKSRFLTESDRENYKSY